MFRLFGRKKDQNPTPTPGWVHWLLLGFVAYAIFAGVKTDRSGTPTRANEAFTQAVTNLNPGKYFNFADFKQVVFPSLDASLHIKEIEAGKGDYVACGQDIAIAYDTFLPDGKKTGDSATAESPKRLRVGEGKSMPVFEQGLIGMQPGGRRSIVAPPSMAHGSSPEYAREDVPPGTSVRFEITLLEASPALPDFVDTSYRVITIAAGVGNTILCGQQGLFHVSVWDIDGKKLYSTKDNNGSPLRITPGRSEVFLGLEQGVIGMGAGSASRTLIVPPAFQSPMRGDKPVIDIPLPGKTVLVDVETVRPRPDANSVMPPLQQ
jgi:peptidylprolyl isomerase